MYLKYGKVISIGLCENVITEYLNSEIKTTSIKSWINEKMLPGNNQVSLRMARVINENFETTFSHSIEKKVGVELTFEVYKESSNLVCGFNLYSNLGVHILSSHDNFNQKRFFKKGIYSATVWIPGNFLSEGLHICSVAVMSYDPFLIHFHETEALSFNIIDSLSTISVRGNFGGHFPGLVRPQLIWDKILD
jgi:lipopolysaccharide transport system ATP-binding protein